MASWLIHSPEISVHIICVGVDPSGHHASINPLSRRERTWIGSRMILPGALHPISPVREPLFNTSCKLVRVYGMVYMSNRGHPLNLDMIAHVATKLRLLPE